MDSQTRLAFFVASVVGPLALVGCIGGDVKTDDTGVLLDDVACLSVPLGDVCPGEADARATLVGTQACETPVREVIETGAFIDSQNVTYTGYGGYNPVGGSGVSDTGNPMTRCCYEAAYIVHEDQGCTIGRPLSVGRDWVRSAPTARADWADALVPDLEGLDAATRAVLAESWTTAALLEHASIPAFARAVLDLVALGAPAELVARTSAALADEIVHARICFALASAFAGHPVGPSGLATPGRRPATLKRLAVETYREGCVGETLAVAVAAAQLREATDPAVRAVLARIVEDESRHAALAWDTVQWAIEVGGPSVRRAVADAAAERRPPASGFGAIAVASRFGLPSDAAARQALTRVMADVIDPSTQALLAA